MNAGDVDHLVARHLGETAGRMRDCAVNELARGEATRRNYFIVKTDLVGSTQMLREAKQVTYVRLAHAYLSTVDRITHEYGADPEQTEYHGDGVLAFFPERGNDAAGALSAAILAHYAVNRLRHEEPGLAWLRPKVLLHFGELAVARIGPWNETHRAAIGTPVHDIAKKEKGVHGQQIWVSDQFARQMVVGDRKALLAGRMVQGTKTAWVPEAPPATAGGSGASLSDLLGLGLMAGGKSPERRLAELAYRYPVTPLTVAPPRMVEKTVLAEVRDGYLLKLAAAYDALRLPKAVLLASA